MRNPGLAPGDREFEFLPGCQRSKQDAETRRRSITHPTTMESIAWISRAARRGQYFRYGMREFRRVASMDKAIHYHLYNDRDARVEIVGEDTLVENGHMTYSRDGRWILSDTYPDAKTNVRLLLLFDTDNHVSYNIGEFFTPPDLGKHNRCDLHPRFSPDNRYISIDSVHEGSRQQYIVDVSGLI